MAVRPIDGDELLGITRLLDTDVIRQNKTASWLLDQVLHDIQAMPTLTPPNEPLTIDKKRVIAESCLHYHKSGRCGLNGYAPLDCPKCKEWQNNEPNEPLTLEQLREINVEPIYVTTKNYGDGWCILNWHGVNRSYTYFSRTGTSEGMSATPLSANTYGDLWIAYRRPPEGEA